MIKAVFFDIDGTLVPFGSRMLDSTLESLYALQRSGVKVIVASGRPKYLIDNVRGFNFDAWVCCNGAHATIGDRTVCSIPIARESIVKVAQIAASKRIPIYLFGAEKAGVNYMNEEAERLRKLINLPMQEVVDVVKMAESEPIYESTVYVTLEEERNILHPEVSDVEYTRWNPYFTDVNPKGLSKATAMKAVLDHFGISISESMAFGDGGNDIQMIAAAGVGVVMANASDEVKSHADYITLDVDNDGVTAALKHFSLI